MTSVSKQKRVKNFQITNWSCNTAKVYEKYEAFIQYVAWGEEFTKIGNQRHHQVFLTLKRATTESKKCLQRIKDWFGECHIEVCKGGMAQNIAYVSKQGKLNELGTKPNQGVRTDLKQLTNEISSGYTTVADIIDNNPQMFHQYGRTLKEVEAKYLRSIQKTELGQQRKGIWYYGGTGVGKSYRAENKPYAFDEETHYEKNLNEAWWDGYKGQDTVIIDEYRAGNKGVFWRDLLKLADSRVHSVPIRHCEKRPFTSKRVVVTSNKHPAAIFQMLNYVEDFKQFERRWFIVRVTGYDEEIIENHPEQFEHLYEPEELAEYEENKAVKRVSSLEETEEEANDLYYGSKYAKFNAIIAEQEANAPTIRRVRAKSNDLTGKQF